MRGEPYPETPVRYTAQPAAPRHHAVMTIHDISVGLALTRPDWAKDAFAYLDQPAARKYPAKPTRLRRRRRA